MGVIATAAAWVVAVAAAVAVDGHRIGGVTVPAAAYAVGLTVVAVVAVAGPPRREVTLPARWRPVAGGALVLGALYVFSGSGEPAAGLPAVPAAGGLLVPAVAVLWPRTAAVRGAVALAVLSLLAPGTPAAGRPLALAAMVAGAAVALVATSRVAAGAGPALDPAAAGPPFRRVGAEMAAVAGVLAVAALLSALVDAPSRPSPPRSGEPAAGGEPAEPSPLTFDDALDPRAAGRGRTGEVLLRIRAPRPDVWRAVTYDRWDGRRWRRPAGVAPVVVPDGARYVPVPIEPFRRGPTEESDQHVRVETTHAAVAVGAPQVRYFEVPGGAAVSSDGSVVLVPPLGPGATYQALSQRAVTTDAELRAAGPARPQTGGDDDLLEAGSVGSRARDLAARITSDAPSALDKVRALERWLEANVVVDDEAGALPAAADPVDDVLFGRRAGPPPRLAATLALLARTVGVPSRVAVGFLPGDRSVLGGPFVVRARHAHAWVEVPFAGLGWQRFDPTGRIARAVEGDSPGGRLGRLVARWWPLLAALVATASTLVALRLVRRRRRRRAVPWATRCFARLVRLGTRRGRPRRPAETPAEYAAALADGVLADDRVRSVGEVVTAAAWSGREPDEATRRWADEVLEEVAAAGRRGRAR